MYFSVSSIGSRKYNNNLYLKTKSPAAQWSCCQYQLPHWKTGSRDPGWKCRKVEKNVAKKQQRKLWLLQCFHDVSARRRLLRGRLTPGRQGCRQLPAPPHPSAACEEQSCTGGSSFPPGLTLLALLHAVARWVTCLGRAGHLVTRGSHLSPECCSFEEMLN